MDARWPDTMGLDLGPPKFIFVLTGGTSLAPPSMAQDMRVALEGLTGACMADNLHGSFCKGGSAFSRHQLHER